jgi:transcriptional regulator with XRE-family HTH domain
MIRPVQDWLSHMADKALRPKWNGDALKRAREARRWSVKDLAQTLGMKNPGLVYKWENSESMPTADWLAAIVLVLDTPAIRLFTGLDEFQARMKMPALVSRRELPIDVDDENTNSSYFSTNGGDAASAPHDEAREPAKRSHTALASPVSEPKRARRSPKRRS